MFDPVQGTEILRIVRIHADSLADVLQGRYLVAQTVVGQGTEIVPPGIPLSRIAQGIQGFPEPSEPLPESSFW